MNEKKPPPCHGPDAHWWDADATLEEHARALLVCHGCPIKDRCRAETEEKFARKTGPKALRGVPGMYAGRMWGDLRRGPLTIWAWHAPKKPPVPHRPAREVECEGPGCTERFTSHTKNGYKRFHNRRCCDNYRRIHGRAGQEKRAS